MTTAILETLSPRRRDRIFGDIRKIVTEVDAQDRSLEGIDEGMRIDEALESIVEVLDEASPEVPARQDAAAA